MTGWIGRAVLAIVLLCACGFVRVRWAGSAAAQQPPLGDVTVSLDMSSVSTQLGDSFELSATISNNNDSATGTLIASIELVALDRTTYVDPEDWASDRKIEVGSIAPHSSAVRSWTVKSVVNGDVGAHVVVLPKSPELAASGPAVSSPVMHIHVQERRPINPGGVLPVAFAVPAAVVLAFAGLRVARRRR